MRQFCVNYSVRLPNEVYKKSGNWIISLEFDDLSLSELSCKMCGLSLSPNITQQAIAVNSTYQIDNCS